MRLILETFDHKAYDAYLTQHISNVQEAYKLLIDNAIVDKTPELDTQIRSHDKSKYEIEEYDAYGEAFYGSKKKHTADIDFKYAWLHHQHQNPHHWQHWCLKKDDSNEIEALPMPENYIIEMICDWWSFSITTGNLQEVQSWYEQNKSKQLLNKDTRARVEDLLDKIANIEESE